MWVGSIGGHGLALVVLVLGHQHLAGLAALKGAYDALFLHFIYQAGGTGIAMRKGEDTLRRGCPELCVNGGRLQFKALAFSPQTG